MKLWFLLQFHFLKKMSKTGFGSFVISISTGVGPGLTLTNEVSSEILLSKHHNHEKFYEIAQQKN